MLVLPPRRSSRDDGPDTARRYPQNVGGRMGPSDKENAAVTTVLSTALSQAGSSVFSTFDTSGAMLPVEAHGQAVGLEKLNEEGP